MTHAAREAAAVSLLLLAAMGACGAEIVEDRGPALTPADMVAHMPNWSADGTEIYFVQPGNAGAGVVAALDAVSMAGDVRVVDEGKGQYSSLAVAPDGTVYYADGPDRHLFSTAAIEPLPIALGPRTDVVAISPDSGRIAYYALNDTPDASGSPPGQLKLFTVSDGSVVTLSDDQPELGGGLMPDYDRALVFSPAADQLFYVTVAPPTRGPGSTAGIVFDLATGATSPRTWDIGFGPLIHWGAEGLRLAAARAGDSYQILNLDTAERVRLSAASTSEAQTDTWSPDGSRIAYWTSSCLESCNLSGCCPGKLQHELMVADVTTRRVHRVAAAADLTIPPGLSWKYGGVAFSPDSSRVAYAIDGIIHVRDVR